MSSYIRRLELFLAKRVSASPRRFNHPFGRANFHSPRHDGSYASQFELFYFVHQRCLFMRSDRLYENLSVQFAGSVFLITHCNSFLSLVLLHRGHLLTLLLCEDL